MEMTMNFDAQTWLAMPFHKWGGEDDIQEAFVADLSSGAWTFATNGRIARSAKGEHGTREPRTHMAKRVKASKDNNLASIFDVPVRGTDTTLQALRDFLPAVKVPKQETCDECHGTGEYICPTCDQNADCQDCVEGKSWKMLEIVKVRVCTVLIDGQLLANNLPPGDESIAIENWDGKGLRIFGNGWCIAVIGITDDLVSKKCDKFLCV